jgi:putative transposase
MSLFQNKYRIETIRSQQWDYSSNALYFVTICTINKEQYLGQITDGVMYPSQLGKIAEKCWEEISVHFPIVDVDVFIAMPNHIHGILAINSPAGSLSEFKKNQFGPQSQNLGSIIRGYKVGVTKFARENKLEFGWQPRFHDHVIQDHESYIKIRNYIITNPSRWFDDKFYCSS